MPRRGDDATFLHFEARFEEDVRKQARCPRLKMVIRIVA